MVSRTRTWRTREGETQSSWPHYNSALCFFFTRISASYAEDDFTCERVEKSIASRYQCFHAGAQRPSPESEKWTTPMTWAATNYPEPHRHSSCPLLLSPPPPSLPPALNPFSVLPWMPTKSGQGKTSDPNPYYQGFNPVILPMLLSPYFGSKSPHSVNPRVAMMDVGGSSQLSTSFTHSLPPLVRVSAS